MAGQQGLTAPATVVFTDASVGEALTYSWKFGDGSDAESINPTHTYQTPGTYILTNPYALVGDARESVQLRTEFDTRNEND